MENNNNTVMAKITNLTLIINVQVNICGYVAIVPTLDGLSKYLGTSPHLPKVAFNATPSFVLFSIIILLHT